VLDRAARRAALLALWPRTGRTHQLRVHCAAIGCPILGDGKYGGEEACSAPSPMPAACICMPGGWLTCPHPSGKGELVIDAQPPPHFRRTVDAFGFSIGGV
jgi:23S rRNA pseudouridine955/2504/2580 synthase